MNIYIYIYIYDFYAVRFPVGLWLKYNASCFKHMQLNKLNNIHEIHVVGVCVLRFVSHVLDKYSVTFDVNESANDWPDKVPGALSFHSANLQTQTHLIMVAETGMAVGKLTMVSKSVS